MDDKQKSDKVTSALREKFPPRPVYFLVCPACEGRSGTLVGTKFLCNTVGCANERKRT